MRTGAMMIEIILIITLWAMAGISMTSGIAAIDMVLRSSQQQQVQHAANFVIADTTDSFQRVVEPTASCNFHGSDIVECLAQASVNIFNDNAYYNDATRLARVAEDNAADAHAYYESKSKTSSSSSITNTRGSDASVGFSAKQDSALASVRAQNVVTPTDTSNSAAASESSLHDDLFAASSASDFQGEQPSNEPQSTGTAYAGSDSPFCDSTDVSDQLGKLCAFQSVQEEYRRTLPRWRRREGMGLTPSRKLQAYNAGTICPLPCMLQATAVMMARQNTTFPSNSRDCLDLLTSLAEQYNHSAPDVKWFEIIDACTKPHTPWLDATHAQAIDHLLSTACGSGLMIQLDAFHIKALTMPEDVEFVAFSPETEACPLSSRVTISISRHHYHDFTDPNINDNAVCVMKQPQSTWLRGAGSASPRSQVSSKQSSARGSPQNMSIGSQAAISPQVSGRHSTASNTLSPSSSQGSGSGHPMSKRSHSNEVQLVGTFNCEYCTFKSQDAKEVKDHLNGSHKFCAVNDDKLADFHLCQCPNCHSIQARNKDGQARQHKATCLPPSQISGVQLGNKEMGGGSQKITDHGVSLSCTDDKGLNVVHSGACLFLAAAKGVHSTALHYWTGVWKQLSDPAGYPSLHKQLSETFAIGDTKHKNINEYKTDRYLKGPSEQPEMQALANVTGRPLVVYQNRSPAHVFFPTGTSSSERNTGNAIRVFYNGSNHFLGISAHASAGVGPNGTRLAVRGTIPATTTAPTTATTTAITGTPIPTSHNGKLALYAKKLVEYGKAADIQARRALYLFLQTIFVEKPAENEGGRAGNEADQNSNIARSVRCLNEIEDNQIGRANRALCSLGCAPINGETKPIIESKYPPPLPNEPPRVPCDHTDEGVPQIMWPAILTLINSKANAVSPGLDNCSYKDLKLIIKLANKNKNGLAGSEVRDGIVLLVNDLASGKMNHSTTRETATSLKGTALNKNEEGTDVRTIAVGPLFTQLSLACIMRSDEMKKLVSEGVGPNEFGIGVPGGVEALPTTILALLQTLPGYVVISTDVENFFQSVHRPLVVACSSVYAPLAPMLHMLYMEPTKVVFKGKNDSLTVVTDRGVAQGSPEASLISSTIIRAAVDSTREKVPDTVALGIIDDKYFLCPADKIVDVVGTYSDELQKLGLKLKHSKCAVYDPQNRPETTAAAQKAGIVHAQGILCAKVPIGTPQFKQAVYSKDFNKSISDVEKVQGFAQDCASMSKLNIPATAGAYSIAFHCLAHAKLTYVMRTAQPDDIAPHLARYDNSIIKLFQCISQTDQDLSDGSSISQAAIARMRLNASDGGLGLASAAENVDAARLGHVALVANLTAKFIATLPASLNAPSLDEIDCEKIIPGTTKLIDALKGNPAVSGPQITPQSLLAGPIKQLSKSINDNRRGERLNSVLNLVERSDDKAFLLSSGEQGAHALTARMPRDEQLSNAEFASVLCIRTGLNASTMPLPDTCEKCGKGTDGNNLHAFTCSEGGKGGLLGQKATRHKLIKRAIIDSFRWVANTLIGVPGVVDTDKEPLCRDYWSLKPSAQPGDINDVDALVNQRPDIKFKPANGAIRLADVTVVHPNTRRHSGAAVVPESAAKYAYEHKLSAYGNWDIPAGQLIPLVWESGGRMHSGSYNFLKTMIFELMPTRDKALWTTETHLIYHTAIKHVLDRTSTASAKGLARAVLTPLGVPSTGLRKYGP